MFGSESSLTSDPEKLVHLRSLRHSVLGTAAAALCAAGLACSGGSSTHTGADPSTSTPADPTNPGTPGNPTDPGTPGNPTDPGTPVTPPPPPVALVGIGDGAMLAGPVDLAATVPAGTARVQFEIDGAVVASAAAAPFSATWDSFSAANGSHTLVARAIDGAGTGTASPAARVQVDNHIRNVFVMVFENTDWASVKGNAAAPYINGTLLAQGAHAERYMNVPGLHPSLPNYIWMEAGSNLGVTDDGDPSAHRLGTSQHLVSLLGAAGISWKSYQEDIAGTDCPLSYVNQYAPRHNPMIYFSDVNGGLDRQSAGCIAHVRPYTELARDLETDAVPAYSFITPNLCNDMHDCGVAAGDKWLAREVPKILNSRAFKRGGALFITFDESEGSDVPIGFMALSPLAKAGYANTISYTHSSMLRTVQEIFGVTPYLGGAANATDLRDLFRSFP